MTARLEPLSQEELAALDRAIDRMGWPEIHAFREEMARGQDIYEDAGGYFLRGLRRLFGLGRQRDEVTTYRDAMRAMVAEANRQASPNGV